MNNQHTLYTKDARDSIRVWEIWSEGNVIHIHHGQLGGAMQLKTEEVPHGKAARSLDQQVASQIQSRVNKQVDKGYVFDLDQARSSRPTNALNMKKPMLAKPYKDVQVPWSNNLVYLQYKYDGNRCLITKQDGQVFAYSRNGKLIDSIDHILEAAKDIPEGTVLDGELYHHGTPLQTIRSWISRKQAASNNLVYMCYDTMASGVFQERFIDLLEMTLGGAIEVAHTLALTPEKVAQEPISRRLKSAMTLGYEGLILRNPAGKYADGKRSKDLVKVKAWNDAEFKVIDVESSIDHWGVLVCQIGNQTFKVTAPGCLGEKRQVLIEKEKYIGKLVTVEFANLTPDGIPFHPVAIAFREPHE
jgi:DNA ligase-1